MGSTAPAPQERDFPFYADMPASLDARKWRAVLLALATGFVALALVTVPAALYPGLAMPLHLAAAAVFTGLPLVTLARRAPARWRALFRLPNLRDLGWALLFLLLAFAVVFATAAAVSSLAPLEPNKIIDIDLSGRHALIWFALWMAVQILGEELFTILPLLAVMQAGFHRHGNRRRALMLAWPASSMLFALAHLPAYNWNLLQCMTVIFAMRLVLTLPYLVTRNLWVSYGVHLVYDGIFVALAILFNMMGHV